MAQIQGHFGGGGESSFTGSVTQRWACANVRALVRCACARRCGACVGATRRVRAHSRHRQRRPDGSHAVPEARALPPLPSDCVVRQRHTRDQLWRAVWSGHRAGGPHRVDHGRGRRSPAQVLKRAHGELALLARCCSTDVRLDGCLRSSHRWQRRALRWAACVLAVPLHALHSKIRFSRRRWTENWPWFVNRLNVTAEMQGDTFFRCCEAAQHTCNWLASRRTCLQHCRPQPEPRAPC